MNADQIYQAQRDEAFADQFEAPEYSAFLAMPFSDRGGYAHDRLRALFAEAHTRANALLDQGEHFTDRRFRALARVDEGSPGAIVITDKIIRGILYSHFFVGDLTGSNFGVVLETGLALALKPNERVIVLTQGQVEALHFDLKVTRVNRFTEETLLQNLAGYLVAAARSFEQEADRYVRSVSVRLTPDAIILLNVYGQIHRTNHEAGLFEQSAADHGGGRFSGAAGRIAFNEAVRELENRRLLETDYRPNTAPGQDSFAIHATRLGWCVIELLWRHDTTMRRNYRPPTQA